MKTHLNPSKLTQNLQLLAPEEFKILYKWLQSPWANANKKLVECYALLQKHHPAFDAKSLTKEDLFAKLYPGKKYDDKWMRNIMGGLSKQAEKFLVHQRLEKDEILTKQLLAKEYLERHRNDWFEKQANDIVTILESKKVKETVDYLNLALIHEDLYNLPNVHQNIAKGHSPLKIADLYLDTFYSISKWRHITELVEQRMINIVDGGGDEKIELLTAITKNLDIPVTDFYRERLEKDSHPTTDKYNELKDKYFSVYDELPLWDRKLILLYLINTIIRIWMSGQVNILNELLELYKFGLDNALLYFHGRLSEPTFANIVTTANSVNDFEFCKNFIDKYAGLMPDDCIEDGRVWATAHWHYEQNNFMKSIELLSQHHIEHKSFVRNSKILLVKSYFDACIADDTYFLFFKDYCNAAVKYFQRDKILSKSRNIAHINFIKYAFRFIKILNNGEASKSQFEQLALELDQEKNIQVKKWLVEKINKKISELSD